MREERNERKRKQLFRRLFRLRHQLARAPNFGHVFVIPERQMLSGRTPNCSPHITRISYDQQTTDLEVSLLVRRFYRHAEVSNKPSVFPLVRFFIRLTQERGRMNSCHNFWRKTRR